MMILLISTPAPNWLAACKRDAPAPNLDLDCQGSAAVVPPVEDAPEELEAAGTTPELMRIERT